MEVFLGWGGCSQRDHILVVLNIEVKLVHGIDFTYSASSFMALEGFDLCSPERIHRIPVLEIAANPWGEILFAFLDSRMDGIVHEDQPCALGYQLIHLFPSRSDYRRAVRIDHNGCSVLD